MTSTQFAPSRLHKAAAHSLRKPKSNFVKIPEWISRKERGSLVALRLMTWFAKTFGRTISRLLLYPITLYYFITARKACRASRDYLGKIYGRSVRWHEVFSHIHAFASVLLDRIYFLLGYHKTFDIRIVSDSYGELAIAKRENGVFLIGAHMGSFEAVRMLARQQNTLQLVLLMYEENARTIGRHLSAINPIAQQEIIEIGQLSAMLKVKESLAQGALVGVLADRFLASEKIAILPFLGSSAPFAKGPFRMAALMKKPVYFMIGLYLGGNRYDIHIECMADFTDAADGSPRNSDVHIRMAMNNYVARLEHFAKVAPFNWFNFYDFWHDNA